MCGLTYRLMQLPLFLFPKAVHSFQGFQYKHKIEACSYFEGQSSVQGKGFKEGTKQLNTFVSMKKHKAKTSITNII